MLNNQNYLAASELKSQKLLRSFLYQDFDVSINVAN